MTFIKYWWYNMIIYEWYWWLDKCYCEWYCEMVWWFVNGFGGPRMILMTTWWIMSLFGWFVVLIFVRGLYGLVYKWLKLVCEWYWWFVNEHWDCVMVYTLTWACKYTCICIYIRIKYIHIHYKDIHAYTYVRTHTHMHILHAYVMHICIYQEDKTGLTLFFTRICYVPNSPSIIHSNPIQTHSLTHSEIEAN